MKNDPYIIQELEKYLPVMSELERDTYFLCVTNILPINFSQKQVKNWEKQLTVHNDKIKNRFNGLTSLN